MTDSAQPKTRRTATPHDIALTIRLTTETDARLAAAAVQHFAKATFARELITQGLDTKNTGGTGETS